MLPRAYRLTESPHIQRTLTEGKPYHANTFVLKSLVQEPTSEQTNTKIATIISKKKLKRAVDRNRARRRLLNQLSPLLPDVKPSHYLVFILKPSLLTISTDELTAQLHEALQQLQLLLPHQK